MKIQLDSLAREGCDYTVQDRTWKQFQVIYGQYDRHIPRIHWHTSNYFNWSVSENWIKRFMAMDIYPNGNVMTYDGKTYELPPNSYTTYDENLKLNFCHKNKVLEIDGLVFDNLNFNKYGLVKEDTGINFTDLYKYANGYYHMAGYLHDAEQAEGMVSKIEYATARTHIYEPTTIEPKDVDGHFIFVGNGTVDIEYKDDDTEWKSKSIKSGSLIILKNNKTIKIVGGDNYHVYEYYAKKDKSKLYELHGVHDSFVE